MPKLKQDLKKGTEVSEEFAKMFPDMVENPSKRWRAEKGGYYYCVDSLGEADWSEEVGNSSDNYRYSIGNYFQTEEEAEKYKERLIIKQELEDLALELNNGVEINWRNLARKYYLYFDHRIGSLEQNDNTSCSVEGVTYCLSNQFLKEAIRRIGEERLLKLFKLNHE